MASRPLTVLALASELKGVPFLEECHRQGCRVVVVMDDKLVNEPWPWTSIDEHFTMRSVRAQPDITYAVSYLARDRHIDRIVGLDDYDVETAAALREHLRIKGLGDSAARLFRDKLAMRVRASDAGLPVPDFAGIFNDDVLRDFLQEVPPPWVFKPRTLAGSEGIHKLYDPVSVWRLLDTLGDRRSSYLLESFVPGDVYHVDTLSWQGETVFSLVSKYGAPPLTVLQGRGIFTTRVLPRAHPDTQVLTRLTNDLLKSFDRDYGPSHSEFIRAADGSFYFLETAARVGGGNIERLVEAATGIVPWREAARLELAHARDEAYSLPPLRDDYAGLIACPSQLPFADTAHYTEPEIVFRPRSAEFASLVVGSESFEKVEALLEDYTARFAKDFLPHG